MQPSSLVFVAIVAVWVAYLVPSWRRQRSELAQWGSADRFSSRLRVLSPRRRSRRSDHRSGDAVLTSPRVVVDSDGELLYIPASPAPVAPLASPRELGAFEISVMHAKIAARRRARIMAVLLVVVVSSWGVASVPAVPFWVGLPASLLFVLHLLASRAAGVRSREHLAVLASQTRAVSVAPALAPVDFVAPVVAPPAPVVPERVARRAAAVGAQTWEPVPVPPPTYTLKPYAPRPEPAPLDLPAAAASVSRGALPRTAADIERILALDPGDDGYDERQVVNG